MDETEEERLNAIERKILQKYGTASGGSQNVGLSSRSIEEVTTLAGYTAPNQQATTDVLVPSAEGQSASNKISICSHCAGVGKLYESMAVCGPEGIRRVLESCCTTCKGMCYITKGEVLNSHELYVSFVTESDILLQDQTSLRTRKEVPKWSVQSKFPCVAADG
jgi:hypothetical protein